MDTPASPPDVPSAAADRAPGKQLKNLPVIALSNGERQGEVQDLLYDTAQGRLLGIVVRRGGGLLAPGELLFLPDAAIRAIGADAVTLDDPAAFRPIEKGDVSTLPEVAALPPVLGKRVMTESGQFLGSVGEVILERASRRIVAYELSGGVWKDMTKGHAALPIEQIVTVGKDVVVVRDTAPASPVAAPPPTEPPGDPT